MQQADARAKVNRSLSLRSDLLKISPRFAIARGGLALTQPADAIPPRLTIGRVCRLTGLRPGTLRNWEERYGLLEPARTAGGTRLYSQGDVRRIQEIQRLLKTNGKSLLAVSRTLAGGRRTVERRTGQRRTGERRTSDRRRAPITAASLKRLFELAGRADLAIENARLLEAANRDLAQAVDFEKQLHYLASTLIQEQDLEAVLRVAAETVRTMFACDGVTICLDQNGQTQVRAVAGTGLDQLHGVVFGPGVEPSVRPVREGRAVLFNDVPHSPLAAHDLQQLVPTQALLIAPLAFGDRLLGSLALFHTRPGRQFGPAATTRVEIVAAKVAAAVANAQTLTAQQEAIRRLDELNRMKSSFLSTMRHELRTPLNAILGFSDLLHSHAAGDLTPKQERYVNNIRQGGRNLLHLVDDILEYSAVQSRETLERELVGVKPLLEEVAATYQAGAESRNITLQIEAGQLPPIAGDRLRLGRAVRQLIDNAVKFTGEGGSVTVRATEADGDVVIAVRDTGPGIGLDDQQRIFEPFVQVDGSESRPHNGSGLGLAIAHRIIALHHGSLTVQSAAGQGSTFIVRLPIANPPAVPKGGNP